MLRLLLDIFATIGMIALRLHFLPRAEEGAGNIQTRTLDPTSPSLPTSSTTSRPITRESTVFHPNGSSLASKSTTKRYTAAHSARHVSPAAIWAAPTRVHMHLLSVKSIALRVSTHTCRVTSPPTMARTFSGHGKPHARPRRRFWCRG
jgi:hypothetical protein